MGKEWDKIGSGKSYEHGGTFTKPGIGEREIAWPSFSSTSKHGTTNPTCAECGGRLRGAKKCDCPKPHDHWKPMGKRRKRPEEDTPEHITGGGMGGHLEAMQAWHVRWLEESYRVLQPGGVVKAFSGTRTFHRLAAAMETAGFTDIRLEVWTYGSGFPKSLNIGRAIDKAARGFPQGGSDPDKRGTGDLPDRLALGMGGKDGSAVTGLTSEYEEYTLTTPEAEQWEGWGTALKPSWEPVLVGTKPPVDNSGDNGGS